MSTDDYVCSKFVPQRLRRTICRNCFQQQKLHVAPKEDSRKRAMTLQPKRQSSEQEQVKRPPPPRGSSIESRTTPPRRIPGGYVRSAADLEKRRSVDFDSIDNKPKSPEQKLPPRPPPPKATPPSRPPQPQLSREPASSSTPPKSEPSSDTSKRRPPPPHPIRRDSSHKSEEVVEQTSEVRKTPARPAPPVPGSKAPHPPSTQSMTVKSPEIQPSSVPPSDKATNLGGKEANKTEKDENLVEKEMFVSLEVPYGPSKLEVEEKLERQVVEEKVESPVLGEKVEAVVEEPEECSSLEGKEEEYYSADEMPTLNNDIDVSREEDESKKEVKEKEMKKELDVSQDSLPEAKTGQSQQVNDSLHVTPPTEDQTVPPNLPQDVTSLNSQVTHANTTSEVTMVTPDSTSKVAMATSDTPAVAEITHDSTPQVAMVTHDSPPKVTMNTLTSEVAMVTPESTPEVPMVPQESTPEVAMVTPESIPEVAMVTPESIPEVAMVTPESIPEVAMVTPESIPKVAMVMQESTPEVAMVTPESIPEVAMVTPESSNVPVAPPPPPVAGLMEDSHHQGQLGDLQDDVPPDVGDKDVSQQVVGEKDPAVATPPVAQALSPNVPPPPPPPPLPINQVSQEVDQPGAVEEERPLRPGSPRPPPFEDRTALLAEIRLGRSLRHINPPPTSMPKTVLVHDFAMMAIRKGVTLNKAPPPESRPPPQLDLHSELKKVQLKKMKTEADGVADRITEFRQPFQELSNQIRILHGQRNPHLRELRRVVCDSEALFEKSKISQSMAEKKYNWPSQLLYPMRLIVDAVVHFEKKMNEMENLVRSYTKERENRDRTVVNTDIIVNYAQAVSRLGSYFQSCMESQTLHSSDIELIMARASEAITALLDMLYVKAFTAYQNALNPTAQKYGDQFKGKYAMDLLNTCCKLTKDLATSAHVPTHPRYLEALEKKDIDPSSTQVGATEEGGPPKDENTDSPVKVLKNTQTQLIEAIKGSNPEKIPELMIEMDPNHFHGMECKLLTVAMATGDCSSVDSVLEGRQKMADSGQLVNVTKHDFDWLCEAVTKGHEDILAHLVNKWKMDPNCVNLENGNTPLHVAAKKPLPQMMAALIKLGANPVALNSSRRTPLHLLAIKCYPALPKVKPVEGKEPLFDLSVYINNPSLSDVVLISEDGKRFHAHRIVLCAQSAVFKAMMASSSWGTQKRQEVKMQQLDAKVVRGLLEYLYTGKCNFTRDDLNLGVELVMAADQFLLEPMRHQCEAVLSEQIDEEVAVPLYNVASLHSTPTLLNAVCHYILMNYEKLSDEGNQALVNLLSNCDVTKQTKPGKIVSYRN